MESKDEETSSVTADSSLDSESDLTSVTETQYEISADNLLKAETTNDSEELIDNKDTSEHKSKQHVGPDLSSPYWYNDKCFARYWRQYHQAMNWYQKHLYLYKSMHHQYRIKTNNLGNSPCQSQHHRVHNHSRSRKRNKHGKHKSNKTKEFNHQTSESGLSQNQEEPMSCAEGEDGSSNALETEEFEMEITDDMLQFFAQSQQHRKERDSKREEKSEDTSVGNLRVNIEDIHKHTPTVEAPKERPGVRRTAEMKILYGKGAAMIHGMETALQMTYDRNIDIHQPKVWPNIPLRITFAD